MQFGQDHTRALETRWTCSKKRLQKVAKCVWLVESEISKLKFDEWKCVRRQKCWFLIHAQSTPIWKKFFDLNSHHGVFQFLEITFQLSLKKWKNFLHLKHDHSTLLSNLRYAMDTYIWHCNLVYRFSRCFMKRFQSTLTPFLSCRHQSSEISSSVSLKK